MGKAIAAVLGVVALGTVAWVFRDEIRILWEGDGADSPSYPALSDGEARELAAAIQARYGVELILDARIPGRCRDVFGGRGLSECPIPAITPS